MVVVPAETGQGTTVTRPRGAPWFLACGRRTGPGTWPGVAAARATLPSQSPAPVPRWRAGYVLTGRLRLTPFGRFLETTRVVKRTEVRRAERRAGCSARLTTEGASRPLSVPAGSYLDDERTCFLPAFASGGPRLAFAVPAPGRNVDLAGPPSKDLPGETSSRARAVVSAAVSRRGITPSRSLMRASKDSILCPTCSSPCASTSVSVLRSAIWNQDVPAVSKSSPRNRPVPRARLGAGASAA